MQKIMMLFMMILMVPAVSAVGLSSSTMPILIKPGESIQIAFSLVNNKNQDIYASVAFDDDLKGYVTLPAREFRLKKGEHKDINATVRFPRSFQGKGENRLAIIATDETHESEQITARTHSVVIRTFVFEEDLKTRIIPQELPVYELPPKLSPINPSIEIGDFFRTSVSVAQSQPVTIFLIAIIVLLILFNIQMRIQRKKAREKIIEEIMKR